jgi:hypothetical protein
MFSHSTKGRNVINIEQIQRSITDYAKEKSLAREVSFWLQKTFLRWVINHYPIVQEVRSVERYKTLVKGDIPLWFRPDDEKINYIYIDLHHNKFQELLEKCSEFLSSRPKNIYHKFPRMTVEQVLKKWEEEHENILRKEKIYKKTSGDGLERVYSFEDLHFVKFSHTHHELSLEMARESALMQHCLGEFDNDEKGVGGYGEYYYGLIRKKEIELFSLRDEKNMPHATIALYKKNGTLWLDQIKGKQNVAPIARYVPACIAFLNFLDVHYNYHSDTLRMGIVHVDGGSKRIEEIKDERIQQFLVAYNAEFIEYFSSPSIATQWLATLREPSRVTQIGSATDCMKITALLQQTMLMLKVKFTLNTTAKEILKSAVKYQIKGRLFRFVKLQVGRV